jgi:hypothetical protein
MVLQDRCADIPAAAYPYRQAGRNNAPTFRARRAPHPAVCAIVVVRFAAQFRVAAEMSWHAL